VRGGIDRDALDLPKGIYSEKHIVRKKKRKIQNGIADVDKLNREGISCLAADVIHRVQAAAISARSILLRAGL
jgi:hypothetical protein